MDSIDRIIRVVPPEEVEHEMRQLKLRTLLCAPLFVGLFVLILWGISDG